jgi:hypothetical protein
MAKTTTKKAVAPKKAAVKTKTRAKKKTTAVARTKKAVIPMNGQGAVRALEEYINRRQTILSFIKDNLIEGKDYGQMWDKDEKKNLYKSGAEKIINWLQLATPKFFPDQEAWVMLGSPSGTICYVCYLVRQENMPAVFREVKKLGLEHEQLVYRQFAEAEGRGAASLSEGRIFDANACVKKCEIRCMKDATLRLGLSGEFGQDMEEWLAQDREHKAASEKRKAEAKKKYTQPKRTVSNAEKKTAQTVPVEKAEEGKGTGVKELAGEIVDGFLDAGVFPESLEQKYRAIVKRHVKAGNRVALEALLKTIKAQV